MLLGIISCVKVIYSPTLVMTLPPALRSLSARIEVMCVLSACVWANSLLNVSLLYGDDVEVVLLCQVS